jgi:GNAT superfamily N-acetyltransferase
MIDVALERVPDDPWRVDTRGMLLSGRAEVLFAAEPEAAADGFVVSIPDAALVSIVGRPPRPLIIDVVRGLDGVVNVLCQPADARHAAGALAGWKRTTALLHTLATRAEWEDGNDEDTRIFTAVDAPTLAHVPGRLRLELVNALRGRTIGRFVPGELPDRDIPPPLEPTPMAAVWASRLPVSFCYPAMRTERWWDISIETLEDHRRHGYAGRAVRAMTRHMWQTGRSPVWGSTIDNEASLTLARSLGFQEVGRLVVFSRDSTA